MITRDDFLKISEIYHGPEGRYNYYPRISNWDDGVLSHEWYYHLSQYESSEIDLYIHIPFCKKFCYFCGCNVKTSTTINSTELYINTLISEWTQYKKFGFKIKNLYFGGGTPNSITKQDFRKILDHLPSVESIHLEYDPRFHDFELLKYLSLKGLKTISMGIQDANEEVLGIIGRETDFEQVAICLEDIKNLNLINVNIDIIFGLPKQGVESITKLKCFLARNDAITSISLFPFAQVPWFKDFYPSWDTQRLNDKDKANLQFDFIDLFLNHEFSPVSFGYFLKKDSEFHKQYELNLLTRSIMGFTNSRSKILIGLGVSSISHSPIFFKQNHKIYDHYVSHYDEFNKSHKRKNLELNIEKDLIELSTKLKFIAPENPMLTKIVNDGLIKINQDSTLSITPIGKFFAQHIPRHIYSDS